MIDTKPRRKPRCTLHWHRIWSATALTLVLCLPAQAQVRAPAPEPVSPAAAAKVAEAKLMQQLRPAIAKCWLIDTTTAAASGKTIQVDFDLRRNGTLVGAPRIVNRRGEPTPVALAQSATRAIQACAPYTNLPADAFDAGSRRIRMLFDARALAP